MASSRPSRAIVDSDQLSTLAASYSLHFEKYSNGRSQVVQVIPAAVWKNVYEEYLEAYPDSTLAEKTLKERLRETLSELDTGTSNEKRSSVAVLQSEEVLKRIRLTNGHASRNVLTHRANLILGKPSFLSEQSSPGEKSRAVCSAPKDAAPTKPVSKAAMLDKQVNAITSIGQSLAESSSQRSASLAKLDALTELKIPREKLKELKELKEMGIITEQEMREKASVLLQ